MKKLRFVALLIWFAVQASGQTASLPDIMQQMLPPELVLSRGDEIGLSAEQRLTLKQSIAELQAKIRPLLEQMRRETDTLAVLLGQEKPDEKAALAQFDKLNAVESELKRLRLRMTLHAKAVLTPEQQAKALALQAKRRGDSSISPNSAGPRPDSLPAKLRRVKEGLERWKREGRDVTRMNELWERFREADAQGRFGEARKALDEALAILESPPEPAKSSKSEPVQR